jgi:hypothetical protein
LYLGYVAETGQPLPVYVKAIKKVDRPTKQNRYPWQFEVKVDPSHREQLNTYRVAQLSAEKQAEQLTQ